MKLRKTKKNSGGRPVKYRTAFNLQAYKLCLLGATDAELADFFETNERTIHRWKKEYKGFCQSLKRGKIEVDAIVAERLFSRATGYSHPDIDIRVIRGKVRKIEITKHYPPDTTAAIFWLKNRRKDKWRDQKNVEIDYDKLSDSQLDYLIERLRNNSK